VVVVMVVVVPNAIQSMTICRLLLPNTTINVLSTVANDILIVMVLQARWKWKALIVLFV